MKRPKTESVAVLTIRGVPRMTTAGRRRIAEWLRMLAKDMQDLGLNYNEKFSARYMAVKK